MRTKLRSAPKKDAGLFLVMPANMKSQLFEVAAERGISAAQVAREGIAAVIARNAMTRIDRKLGL